LISGKGAKRAKKRKTYQRILDSKYPENVKLRLTKDITLPIMTEIAIDQKSIATELLGKI
jgi:hypothetical protein